uniref:Serine-threonine protein kinase, plant-type n=1 Tax=Solanum tuberosum TaxID=4113 RepID=M1D4L8_SOLTU
MRRLSLLLWTLRSIKYSVFDIRFQTLQFLFLNIFEFLVKRKIFKAYYFGTPEYTHQD